MNAWDQIGGDVWTPERVLLPPVEEVPPRPVVIDDPVTWADIDQAREALGAAIDVEAHERRVLEIFGVEPPPVVAGVSAFRFRATIQSRQAVRFAGPGGFYDAELLKGGLGGLIGFGLQQLGRPSGLVARVRSGNFDVYAPNWTKYNPGAGTKPREDGQFQNRMGPRRILIIEGRELAVLRFKKQIPERLIKALKCLFAGREYHRRQPGLGEAHEGDDDGAADMP